MEEVEYLCERIGIIDHGELIASGYITELRETIGDHSKIVLTLDKETANHRDHYSIVNKNIFGKRYSSEDNQLMSFS